MDYYFSSDIGKAISANMMAFAETIRYLNKEGGLPDNVSSDKYGSPEDMADMADFISDKICTVAHDGGGRVSLDKGDYLMVLSAVRQALDFYMDDFESVEKAISEASHRDLGMPSTEQMLNTIRKTTFLVEYLEVNATPEVFKDWMSFKKEILTRAIEGGMGRFCSDEE